MTYVDTHWQWHAVTPSHPGAEWVFETQQPDGADDPPDTTPLPEEDASSVPETSADPVTDTDSGDANEEETDNAPA